MLLLLLMLMLLFMFLLLLAVVADDCWLLVMSCYWLMMVPFLFRLRLFYHVSGAGTMTAVVVAEWENFMLHSRDGWAKNIDLMTACTEQASTQKTPICSPRRRFGRQEGVIKKCSARTAWSKSEVSMLARNSHRPLGDDCQSLGVDLPTHARQWP